MSKIRCIIIEDEPLAVKVLSDYIREVPFLELQGHFKDAILATDWLREATTDLIFLDIHLPKLKGLAFLKMLPHPPAVIITTAYHQYAVEGFNLNVTDYLLKPIEFERFLVAVAKVRKTLPMGFPLPGATGIAGAPGVSGDSAAPGVGMTPGNSGVSGDTGASATPGIRAVPPTPPAPADRDFFFISVQKKKVRVIFEDILFVESQREYVKVVTVKGEYLTKLSTHEIESLLPLALFRRVHRSFIVSLRRIESYSAEMVEVGGLSIPIGKGYRESLEDL
jgi:two-component system, LytTR family, response regulator